MAKIAQVEELLETAEVITDTIPASVFAGVERFYARRGYRLQSFLLVSGGIYEATFAIAEK